MPFGLGFFATAAGAAPVAVGDYDLLTTTLVGTAVASVTFDVTPYSSTYKHLQIRFVAKSDRGSYADDAIAMTFNSDSVTTNYKAHGLWGGGSSGLASGVNSQADWFYSTGISSITTTTATSGDFGAGVIDILDPFITTKNKTSRALSGFMESSSAINSYSAARIYLTSHLWMNTNAITSITLDQGGGSNFVQYSRFSLYGLKG